MKRRFVHPVTAEIQDLSLGRGAERSASSALFSIFQREVELLRHSENIPYEKFIGVIHLPSRGCEIEINSETRVARCLTDNVSSLPGQPLPSHI